MAKSERMMNSIPLKLKVNPCSFGRSAEFLTEAQVLEHSIQVPLCADSSAEHEGEMKAIRSTLEFRSKDDGLGWMALNSGIEVYRPKLEELRGPIVRMEVINEMESSPLTEGGGGEGS